jgi:hypothetical protein
MLASVLFACSVATQWSLSVAQTFNPPRCAQILFFYFSGCAVELLCSYYGTMWKLTRVCNTSIKQHVINTEFQTFETQYIKLVAHLPYGMYDCGLAFACIM